jgi:ribosomal protein S12 methylthiotransferase accessory factor YcaO
MSERDDIEKLANWEGMRARILLMRRKHTADSYADILELTVALLRNIEEAFQAYAEEASRAKDEVEKQRYATDLQHVRDELLQILLFLANILPLDDEFSTERYAANVFEEIAALLQRIGEGLQIHARMAAEETDGIERWRYAKDLQCVQEKLSRILAVLAATEEVM